MTFVILVRKITCKNKFLHRNSYYCHCLLFARTSCLLCWTSSIYQQRYHIFSRIDRFVGGPTKYMKRKLAKAEILVSFVLLYNGIYWTKNHAFTHLSSKENFSRNFPTFSSPYWMSASCGQFPKRNTCY